MWLLQATQKCKQECVKKKSNQSGILRIGMWSKSLSCNVFTGKDRACLPTKTLRQSLSELERLHFATCTSPPDRPATSGPKSETMSRAVSTMETHGALAKQGNQPKDICRFDLVDATTVMKRDKCKHPYKRCTFYMRQVVDFMQICTCARMNACIRFLQAASQHVPSFFESTCKKTHGQHI